MPTSKIWISGFLLTLGSGVLAVYLYTARLQAHYSVGTCFYDFATHEKRDLTQGSPFLLKKLDRLNAFSIAYFEYDHQCWLAPNYYRGEPCWKRKQSFSFLGSALRGHRPLPNCPLDPRDHYLEENLSNF